MIKKATGFLNKRSGTQVYHDWKPMQSIIDILYKNFQDHTNSRFPGGFLNSSRFPGVADNPQYESCRSCCWLWIVCVQLRIDWHVSIWLSDIWSRTSDILLLIVWTVYRRHQLVTSLYSPLAVSTFNVNEWTIWIHCTFGLHQWPIGNTLATKSAYV